MGSDRGLLRVASEELRRLARRVSAHPVVHVFNEGDGLRNAQCSEGFQPTALLDAATNLWFATLGGVVTVDPRAVRINTLAPPVVIERLTYRTPQGAQRVILAPEGNIDLPAGSTDLDVRCAALSYAAPEKNRYAFRLEAVGPDWVDLGNRRDAYFAAPGHGRYQLRIRGSNNDGLWNESGARLRITVLPFAWQTWWFRGKAAAALVGGVGGSVWQVQQRKLQREKMRLERERALAQEQARLASILEGATDFVAFTSLDGSLLYLNPAGRRMAGVGDKEDVTRLSLRDFEPEEVATSMLHTTVPAAVRDGTWTGIRHQPSAPKEAAARYHPAPSPTCGLTSVRWQ
jgi:PAS domain-containing protein